MTSEVTVSITSLDRASVTQVTLHPLPALCSNAISAVNTAMRNATSAPGGRTMYRSTQGPSAGMSSSHPTRCGCRPVGGCQRPRRLRCVPITKSTFIKLTGDGAITGVLPGP
jgi:hypothetical protein